MVHYTKQDIIQMVEEEDVQFIRLQFVDIFGTLKNMAVTASQIEMVLNNQVMFDAAAIEGVDTQKVSELILVPDLDTFAIFPWRPQRGRVARFICDVLNPDGTPFEADPRYILKKTMKEAHDMGYTFNVGPESEFFLFDTSENGEPTTDSSEKGGLFDISPVDTGENARRDMVLSLKEMGFEVETSFHAAEIAQNEIVFKYDKALQTADNLMTYKLAVRTVAKRHGLHATFMPKPRYGLRGSGMIFNMSLLKDGKNIFVDESADDGFSKDAYHFMAGIMNHIKGMTLINNPIVNSYKRLVPGYMAPVNISWSRTNRTPLIRLTKAGRLGSRVVLRSPDGACNPYLVLACCLKAGLDGIKKELIPPMSEDEASETEQFEILPRTLMEATRAFEQDEFLRDVVGKQIADTFIEEKKEEWNNFCKQVTAWEVDQYLDRI